MVDFEIIVGSMLGASEYVAEALQETLSMGFQEAFCTSEMMGVLERVLMQDVPYLAFWTRGTQRMIRDFLRKTILTRRVPSHCLIIKLIVGF